MTATVPALTIPSRLPGMVEDDWVRLAAPTPSPPEFDPAMVADLPAPARRWLTHAIAPGTPLCRAALFAQHGQIRLGSWQRLRATQVLAALDGFVWAAATSALGLPVTGFDRYSRGSGELRHRLLGLIPVASAAGADITRGAAGRLAVETVLVPAAAAADPVRWQPVDDRRATMLVPAGGHTHEVTVTVAGSGALREVSMPRWARHGRSGYGERIFTVTVAAEATFEGFTIPASMSAGYQPEGASIRLEIDSATYR